MQSQRSIINSYDNETYYSALIYIMLLYIISAVRYTVNKTKNRKTCECEKNDSPSSSDPEQ